MKIGMLLPSTRDLKWDLAVQAGVTHAVTKIAQKRVGPYNPWDYFSLLQLKNSFHEAGLCLHALEGDQFDMSRIKLGLPGRDEDIARFRELLKNMGALGIPVLCFNFMVHFGWLRTSVAKKTRGGALATAFDYGTIESAPLTEWGFVSEEKVWDNLQYFLERVIPMAEEANVKLALHPDDPPISPIRGISRILTGVEAYERVFELFPSNNLGMAFCQGTFSTMGVDIPSTIQHFGKMGKIFFVHFRDIVGNASSFEETFHDNGQTDMLKAMKCYREIGFDGVVRPDHAPTMAGEDNSDPGYAAIGRLIGVGYIRGLMESVYSVV